MAIPSLGVLSVGDAHPIQGSSIKLGRNDVQAPQYGDHVGEQVIFDHMREHRKVNEGRRAGPHAPRGLAAVSNQVLTELAVRALDRGIHFIMRR
jgi:hypothetical protein